MDVKIELWCLVVTVVMDDLLNYLLLLFYQVLSFVVEVFEYNVLDNVCKYRFYIVICWVPKYGVYWYQDVAQKNWKVLQ